MRCGCPECEVYMVHAESGNGACVCPECGWRCDACLGTNTVLTGEELRKAGERLAERMEQGIGEYISPDAPERWL